MERRQLVMSGLGLLGAAAALAAEEKEKAQPGAVKTVEASPEAIQGVKAALEQHDKAFTNHDLEGVLAAYQTGPHAVLMGTGPGEMWAGKEEIGDAYKHFFADFDKGAQDFKYAFVNAEARGDVAWLSAMGDVVCRKEGKEKKFALNVSCVLVKDQDAWKISLLHFSNLTGPEKPQA